jgi:uncharacterized protein (TIGR02099 family)
VKHIVFSMTKKTGYLLSVLVILAAIAMVVLGILTPYLNSRLPNIEAWASQLLELPLTIESVHLSWYKYDPEITLNKVTFLSRDSKKPTVQIEAVRVFFSLPKSLWQRQLVLDGVMVKGADLIVKQDAKGEFVVQGFPAIGGYQNQPYARESKFTDVVTWLTLQPHLFLQDIDLRYTGMHGQERYVTLYNLSLKNEGEKHTVLGSAILHQALPTKVTLAIQCVGNVMDPATLNARIYAYVSGLALSQWWKGLSYQGWQVNDGLVSAKTWAVWNQGAWQRVQSQLLLYDANLYSNADHSAHPIDRLSATVGWMQSGNQQIIAGDDVLLDLPKHLWPSTSFYVALTPSANQTWVPTRIRTGYLNVSDALSFVLSSSGGLPPSLRQFITQTKLQGDVTQSDISLAAAPTLQNTKLAMGLSRLQLQPYQAYPGVDNISGQLTWDGQAGQLHLNSEHAVLTLNAVFAQPVNIGKLVGDVTWQQDANAHWQITIPNLGISNDALALSFNKSTLIFDQAMPTVDISGDITVAAAEKIAPYLPLHVFSPNLGHWLSTAFLSGQAEDGHFVLRGKVDDFPFDKNNGEFSVIAKVKGVTLRYADDWPLVDNINASLSFAGRNMTVKADEAHVLSIPVSGVEAVIPNLGSDDPNLLQVTNIQINTDFSKGLAFVQQSPLQKTIGRLFKDVAVNGPMTLRLKLTVPLDNPDNTVVDGQIGLSEARLNLVPWRLNIDHLNGLVNFSEKSTDANALQGQLFGEPLTLSLATIAPSKAPAYVQAKVATHCRLSDLEDWLHVPVSQFATGSTDLTATLNLGFDQPVQVNLQSNLQGVAIKLPAPYGKPANTAVPFSADLTIQDNQPLKAKVSYGQLVQAALFLQAKNDRFDLTAANVMLGQGSPDWPSGKGLSITANFDTLDWDTIKSYQSQMSGGSVSSVLPLKSVNINAKKIALLSQTMTAASISAVPMASFWNVTIKSNQLSGALKVPMNLTSRSEITANLDYVNLQTSSTSQVDTLSARDIPSLSISAANVAWNGMQLGAVSLQTAPTASGMAIKQLQLRANGVSMDSAGSWVQSGSRSTTQLDGSITATSLSTWLAQLGVDAHNLVATKGQAKFNLQWRAAPSDLSLKTLNGGVNITLGPGRIVDVGDTSGAKMDLGKMLSIFSLQTIPRRLSLDFSDVFQKGYSFDSFKGDFNFVNGNAVTKNTRFDGPVARVEINGAIGLAAKTYDFTLSVTPYVTSSIPVAAAIISGPVAGIAALAVNKIISSQVAKVTTYYYAVGGSWSNPTWAEVKTQPAT